VELTVVKAAYSERLSITVYMPSEANTLGTVLQGDGVGLLKLRFYGKQRKAPGVFS
jgi:hypothetical protein